MGCPASWAIVFDSSLLFCRNPFAWSLGRVVTLGACVTRSIDTVLEILCLSIVTVCCCTLSMRKGPDVRNCNLLYVRFAYASPETSKVANNGGLSTKTCSPTTKDGVSRTLRSLPCLYRACDFRMCVSTLDRSAIMRD